MFENYIKAKSYILDERSVLGSRQEHSRGTVYTPEYIGKYMVYLLIRDYLVNQSLLTVSVDQLLKRICVEHTLENCDPKLLTQKEKETLKRLLELLKPLSIMDLACGTGVLLLAYLELCLMLMLFLEVSKKEMLNVMKTIVENQVYAYDINDEAIEKYIEILHQLLRCLESTCCLNCKHVYTGNSLLLDHPLKVDLVIGNPPYIGEKGNLDLFAEIKKSAFGQKNYEGKMDYFYFFIYKAYQYLKPKGSLCYLTSNYFFTADGALKLRTFIKSKFNFSQMLNFNGENIFKNKKLHACIYTLTLIKQNKIRLIDSNLELKKLLNASEVYLSSDTFHFISNEIASRILARIERKFKKVLGDDFEIKQGIVSGADRMAGQPVFVYTKEELSQIPQNMLGDVKPFYKNSAIKHFKHDDQTLYYIIYCDKTMKYKDDMKLLLEPYREKLEKRREVIKGVRQWYELTWPREASMFTRPKIVVPQRARSNYFAYSEGPFHASADVYYIFEKADSKKIDTNILKGLTAYLNSYIVLLFLYFKGKRKGDALELYSTPLKSIPYDPKFLDPLVRLGDLRTSVDKHLEAINTIIYDYLGLESDEREWLNKFGRNFL